MLVTVCRLYDSYGDAMLVVGELEAADVPSSDISVISNNADNWLSESGEPSIAPGRGQSASAGAREQTSQGAQTGARETPATRAGQQARSGQATTASPGQQTGQQRSSDREDRLEAAAVGAAIGATAGTAASLLTALAIPGIGPVVGAGWLVALLGGAAVGGITGGLLGALTRAGVSEDDAQVYAEGVRRGGSVVSARVPPADQRRVERVMDRSAVDIRERGTDYRNSGWRSFNPEDAPYTAEQVRNERALHTTH
jgi:hypothetical protein